MPNQAVKNGLKAKKIKLLQINFFSRKAIKFSCTYQPLSFCKILKQFLELLQSYQDVPNLFWYKPFYYFHLPFWPFIVGPFHCAKLPKKSYSRSKFVRMSHLWVQNGAFAPSKKFFVRKFINIIFT